MKLIPHNRPTIGRKEAAAASKAIRSGWVAPFGRQTALFEAETADFLGLAPENVLAVSSGSAALFLALWALETEQVNIPAYSCAAVTSAARQNDSTIQYLDSSAINPNIDKYSTELNRVQSVVVISNFGIPAEIEFNNAHRTVEDISQAFGARAFHRPLGTSGAFGVASFAATKLITTGGQGGVIFSSNSNLIESARDFVDFDMKADAVPRFNFLMTDLQAAVGRVQLSRLSEFTERRREIFQIYLEAGLPLLQFGNFPSEPIHFRAVLQIENPKIIKQKLEQVGISSIIPYESREFFPSAEKAPMAHHWAGTTLSLPIYPSLKMRDAKFIAQVVADVLN